MKRKTLHEELIAILKCGWSPAWSIQAALRGQKRHLSESTVGRQLRLLKSLRKDVENRPGKGRAFEWRIARKRAK